MTNFVKPSQCQTGRHSVLIGLLLLLFSSFLMSDDQVLTAVPSSIDIQPNAKDIEVVFVYSTSPLGVRTTGLGVSIYFDSSKLEFDSMSALYEGGIVGISETPALIQSDSNNDDGDIATDSRAVIAYVDVGGNWPSSPAELPLDLFSIKFDAVSTTKVAKTNVNLILDTASGFSGVAESVTSDSCLDCFSIDSDGDGVISPVTDALLISRFLNGYTGSALISDAIGTNATRTSASSIISYLDSNKAQLDVDGDGAHDLQTDAMLITRYLFGLRDEGLTTGLLSENSSRSEPSKIADYIESRMYVGAPTLINFANEVSIDENQVEVISVTALDPNGEEINYSLSGSDSNSLTIDIDGKITFLTPPDYEQKSEYKIQVLVANEENVTSQDLVISILDIDEPPIILSPPALVSIPENQSEIASIEATDPEGAAMTFSLTGGDSSYFQIDSIGDLALREPADYEDVSTYHLELNGSDGALTVTRELTVIVEDIDEPPIISGLEERITIPKGELSVTAITAIDPESKALAFSITGPDADLFSVSSNGLVLFQGDAGEGVENEYSIQIEVSDGSNVVSQSLIVVVEGSESSWGFIDLPDTIFVFENVSAITTIRASDGDGGVLSYSLGGLDSPSMAMDSESGALSFVQPANFESKSVYSITVIATNGQSQVSKEITVGITDVNEAPDFSVSSSFTIPENQKYVGSISAVDPDGDDLTFSVSGPDSGSFALSSFGEISFLESPDFETAQSYSFSVGVSDGEFFTDQEVLVAITDLNESPIITEPSSVISILENTLAVTSVVAIDPEGQQLSYQLREGDSALLAITDTGDISFLSNSDFESKDNYAAILSVSDGLNVTEQSLSIQLLDELESPVIVALPDQISVNERQNSVLTVNATDPQTDQLTFSLSGSDASALTISSAGVISFLVSPDYARKSSYSIVVNVTDGTSVTSQSLEILILDINSAPQFSNLSETLSVPENTTQITTLSATDADNDALSFSFTGIEVAEFNLNPAGVLSFKVPADYETKSQYLLTVSVSDGVLNSQKQITINVSDVNEAPFISGLASSISIYEGISNVTTVVAEDPEGSDLVFSLSGLDATDLSISSAGVLSFNAAPDYETKNKYVVMISVSDGTSKADHWLEIIIADQDEAPVIEALPSSINVAENQLAVLTVSVSDPQGDPISFTLTSTDASLFTISEAGEIRFKVAPNYEESTQYNLVVNASDGTNSTSQSLIINVTDVDDLPTFINLADTVSAAENQTTVVALEVTDPQDDALTFSLQGRDYDLFTISSVGVISFKSIPDFETDQSSYLITVIVRDDTNLVTRALTVQLTNVDEPPSFVSLPGTVEISEGESEILQIQVVDVDSSSFSYGLTGSDAGSFTVSATGFVSLVSPADRENKSSYEFVLTVSDGTTEVLSGTVYVEVKDVNEAPTIVVSPVISIVEGSTFVADVQVSDPEGDPIFLATKGEDGDLLQATESGGLSFIAPPDFEAPADANKNNEYVISLEASDGSLTVSTQVIISVTDNPETYNISGTVFTNNVTVLDRDLPSSNWSSGTNDSKDDAQDIFVPSVIVGSLGQKDELDFYKFVGAANLTASLEVSDFSENNNINLYLYDADGKFQDSVIDANQSKAMVLPTEGIFYLVPRLAKGESKYVIEFSQSSGAATQNSSFSQYVKNEILTYVPFFGPPKSDNGNTASQQRKPQTATYAKEVLTKIFRDDPLESGSKKYTLDLGSAPKSKATKIQFNLKDSSGLSHTEEQLRDIQFREYVADLQLLFPERNIHLNYLVKRSSVFLADPRKEQQWHVDRIKLPVALNAIGQETKNVVVAVIDSGSPAQSSTAWKTSAFVLGGYDFVEGANTGDGNGRDGDPTDPEARYGYTIINGRVQGSHGTHVGTTIAARNDGKDYNGMAVKVLPLRVFPVGENSTVSIYTEEQALLYAADLNNVSGTKYSSLLNPVKVVNMSLGGLGGRCHIQTVLNDVRAKGISVVASAGNNAHKQPNPHTSKIGYPASCEGVISVAATTKLDKRTYFSDYNDFVDIAAPGEDICAYYWDEREGCIPGTSMASPQVAGAVALMYAVNPELTPDDIDALLMQGKMTRDILTPGKDPETGYGLLDVAKAVDAANGSGELTYATVSPSVLNFGYSKTEIMVELTKVGSGALSVSRLTIRSGSASGLTYNSDVNAEGFGSYTFSLDRAKIENGTFRESLNFVMSDGSSVSTLVNYSKGTERARTDIKKLWVLLIGEDQKNQNKLIDLEGGTAVFSFDQVPEGNYWLCLSTDIDGNNRVCEQGEVYARYPGSSGRSNRFLLDREMSGIEATVEAKSFNFSATSSSIE